MHLSCHPFPISLAEAKRNIQEATGQFASVSIKRFPGGNERIIVALNDSTLLKRAESAFESLGIEPIHRVDGLYYYQGQQVELQLERSLDSTEFPPRRR